MTEPQIPIAHLSDFDDPQKKGQFIEAVGAGLKDFGFFILDSHQVNLDLIRSAYQSAHDLFTQPQSVLQKYEDVSTKGQRGFTRFGKEHAKDSAFPDLKEFWQIGNPQNSSAAVPENMWPAETPQFESNFTRLYEILENTGRTLLKACALYLQLPETLFSSMAENGDSILRVIHYPPLPEDRDPSSIRAAAHEDINFITLLCESTAPGLELLRKDGTWKPVKAKPGQIIVDSGDMLQNITNGVFRSTTHRVINPDNSRDRRFSIPFFVHAKPECSLTPLKSCIEMTGGKARYPAITAKKYLEQRLAEIGFS